MPSPDPSCPRRLCPAARACMLTAGLATAVALAAGCAPSDGGGADLFPSRRGPYERVTPVTRFTPETLYEYINGQAPYVVSFGFVELATADYRRGDEPVTTVDVYDMGSVTNAFALFRSNANVEASPVEVGTEGAGGGGRIEFWQNRYYVTVSNPAAEDPAHVRQLAVRLAADLPATDHRPAFLDWLPADARIPRSEKYLPEAYLGYEPLARAVSARYTVGPLADDAEPREITLFVCGYDSAAAAGEALAEFRSQIAAGAAPVPLAAADLDALGRRGPAADEPAQEADTAHSDGTAEGFVAERFVMGPLVIFRAGRYLAGLLPYDGSPPARARLALLADHLGRL